MLMSSLELLDACKKSQKLWSFLMAQKGENCCNLPIRINEVVMLILKKYSVDGVAGTMMCDNDR